MRAFFRRHRGLHIWFLAVCGVLGLYFALRTVPGLMNWVSRQVVMPLERTVASVCYRASFSVAELLECRLPHKFFVANPRRAIPCRFQRRKNVNLVTYRHILRPLLKIIRAIWR